MTGSDDLDRLLTDSLRSHVRDVHAGPDLRDRIDDTVGGPEQPTERRRRPVWLATAAAAAVVLAVLAWDGTRDDGRQDVASEPPGEATDRTSTDPVGGPTTVDPPAAPAADALPAPDRAIVAYTSSDGLTSELALVDLTNGTRISTVTTVDNAGCGDVAACHVAYASTAVTATHDVLVETCCEPAGGNVARYPNAATDGGGDPGRPEQFLAGFDPAVHPNGRTVATAGLVSIEIRDVVSAGTTSIGLLADGESAGTVLPTGLAWSPDGERLAVSVEDGRGGSTLVVVAADASSLAEGTVVGRYPGRRTVQTWTADGRIWLLHSDSTAGPHPVSAVDPDTGTTTTFDATARQVVSDRTGHHLHIVTEDGLRRADMRATSDRELVGQLVVPSGNGVIGAVSVFPSVECATAGSATVTVPDVTGLPLSEAVDAVEAAGLRVVGTGTPAGDPGEPDATVTAQAPPAATAVPPGACVGLRTAS